MKLTGDIADALNVAEEDIVEGALIPTNGTITVSYLEDGAPWFAVLRERGASPGFEVMEVIPIPRDKWEEHLRQVTEATRPRLRRA
jgi:hypothetical protein